MYDFSAITQFVRKAFRQPEGFIPLHAPYFGGNEKKYLNDCIDSTFVSSVGAYVNRFEEMMQEITGAKYAIAIVNGTNALHIALVLSGVHQGDEVLSQALTFIATANAISYTGAKPVFVDVDTETAGMSPDALSRFLQNNAEMREDGNCYNKKTGKCLRACIPMHTFGLPCRIEEIAAICSKWNIALIEDAAESLGSYVNGQHTGTFGQIGTFSFNGNKTVTCGGGGALVTNDEALARHAKHLTTQAKVPHVWDFVHDEIGYNYRMPNLNAALACAQLEQLERILADKKELANAYQEFFAKNNEANFLPGLEGTSPNYWLNAILLADRSTRDEFLTYANNEGVMSRPVWELMNRLPMFATCQTDGLENSMYLADRIVNLPSSYRN